MAEGAQGDLTTGSLLQVFGGWKGLLDSSLPATVFVLVRFVAGLNASIAAAVLAGLVVVVLRRRQGEPLQQALNGFLGLVVAVLVVRGTGTGKGIFLPGILITAASGAAFGLSLLLGRPAVALALTAVDEKYGAWRTHPPLRRACVLATGAWCASFFVRAAVATTVYLLAGDSPGDNLAVLVVINAVKWPLIVVSALLTVSLVRRAGLPAQEQDAAPRP